MYAATVILVEEDARAVLFATRHKSRDLKDAPCLHHNRAWRSEQVLKSKFDGVPVFQEASDAFDICWQQITGKVSAIVDAFGARTNCSCESKLSASVGGRRHRLVGGCVVHHQIARRLDFPRRLLPEKTSLSGW